MSALWMSQVIFIAEVCVGNFSFLNDLGKENNLQDLMYTLATETLHFNSCCVISAAIAIISCFYDADFHMVVICSSSES